ncbi:MAG: IS1380 family transposase [Candidatus Eisenbacteria bacterium]
MSRPVKRELRVEFTESNLTSYAGLELLIRYFRSTRLNQLIRYHFEGRCIRGDYGVVPIVRLFLGLLMVGGRRLQHVDFLRGDILFHRFCGLSRLPSARTLSRWLKNFTSSSLEALRSINAEIVARAVCLLPLRTLTIDVDGSVVSTGLQVERAFRGFNPHHRKVPSYYPITAYLSETGHILRVKNRSGNIHDGKASIPFLRDLFGQINETLGQCYRLNFRMDAAFFTAPVLKLLAARQAGYAIKVPFWKWLELTRLIRERRRWKRINHQVDGFEEELTLFPWGMTQRVVIYRKRVFHKSRRNYQLDLFDPDDGYYEYSAITTNLSWAPKQLWNYMCGRGAHERVIGELKSHLAFDTVPTNRFGANSAWQQIVAIVHNLLTNFQIDTGAGRRHRTHKRTNLFNLKTAQSLRFEVLNHAGRIVRPNGATILRLSKNILHKRTFMKMTEALKTI